MTRRRTRPQVAGEIPRWKLAVATGLLAAVAIAALAIATWRGVLSPAALSGGGATDAPSSTTAPAAGAAADGRQDAASAPPAVAADVTRRHPEVAAALRAALRAWEAFARSGDLADVDEAFVADGPQYRRFRREARTGRAGVDRVPAFSLQAVPRVAQVERRRRRAVAQVALTGDDGVPEVREWVFVLQRDAGTWRVWTVIDPAADG